MFDFIELSKDSRWQAYPPLVYKGTHWDLSHLNAFAFKVDPGLGFKVDVVVVFSCHCFTHSLKRDGRPWKEIYADEFFDDGRERRILDPERYKFSRDILRSLVLQLAEQRIILAGERQLNFMTWQVLTDNGKASVYAVFFDVTKDSVRKRRLILRIQSAYLLEEGLNHKQKRAKAVRWITLLKAAYEGRKILP